MRLTIMKFVFTIVIFICWSTSIANDVHFPLIENYVNESFPSLCNDDISLNFSNAVISEINQNFISSPIITCLNLMGNNIKNIGRGAFDNLPNLTQLFLSNNTFRDSSKLLNFGSHDKLQVLVMNNAGKYYCPRSNLHYRRYPPKINLQIFGEYPNLEILSLRTNCIDDLQFEQNTQFFELRFTTTPTTSQSRIPFPKLKILDLSENIITGTNFVQLLSDSLYFLDLHDNSLYYLNLNKKGNKLFALNLDNNCFSHISYYSNFLSLADLKDLQYLSVSTNEIVSIELDAFQDNNKLLYLNLSRNNINYLHPQTFANLQYLKTLDLSINKFEDIPQFLNETGISTLYMNSNNIKKIISHTFMHMPKLIKLSIGDNEINEINVNAFVHLTVLEELDLSRNMLSSLPKEWMESLVSLKYLDLSDNKFTSLESLSLMSTLPLLEVLYLMKNSLEYLNVKHFENLPQNLTIDLVNKSNFTKWNIRNLNENKYKYQCKFEY